MHFRYLVPCLLLISACSPTYSFETADQMQRYLTERIPAGTPIEQAKQVAKAEGFEISPVIRKTPTSDGNKTKSYNNYIFVGRVDGFIFVREWQIEIYFENEKVTNIRVDMHNVAP